MQLKVNPILIEQVARELDNIANDVAEGRTALRQAADATANAWQSQFTGQFLQSVDTTQNRIDTCAQNIRALAQKLRGTAAEVRRVETAIKRLKSRTT